MSVGGELSKDAVGAEDVVVRLNLEGRGRKKGVLFQEVFVFVSIGHWFETDSGSGQLGREEDLGKLVVVGRGINFHF
jgi:hypothetical protein